MKKLVFATQVFGLLAMFPIVVFLEMNHATGNLPGSLPGNSNFSKAVSASAKPFVGLTKKLNDKKLDEVFNVTIRKSF